MYNMMILIQRPNLPHRNRESSTGNREVIKGKFRELEKAERRKE